MFSQLVVVVLLALLGTSSAMLPVIMTALTTCVSMMNEGFTFWGGMDAIGGLFTQDNSTEVYRNTVLDKLDSILMATKKMDDIAKQITDLNNAMQDSTNRIIASVEFNRAKEIVAYFRKNCDYMNNVYKERYATIKNRMKTYKPDSSSCQSSGLVCDCSLERSLSELYSDISSSLSSQSNIFAAMAKYYDPLNGYEYRCENITPMDRLQIFVGDVIASMSKGQALVILIQKYQQMTSPPGEAKFYGEQQKVTLKNFKETMEGVIRHAQLNFESMSSNLRGSYACDPSEWKEGVNYIRVKNYISFQWSDNDDIKKNATAEELARSKEYDCDGYAAYRGAPGTKVGTNSFVCTSPFDPKLPNPNTVEYKELENPVARIWESRTCVRGSTDYNGKYCNLDQNSDPFLSIRKLSLRLQECDTKKNEVVTGARFHEQDNKIHIKLQCGVLKSGIIDPKTLRWTEDNKPLSGKEYVVLGSKVKRFNLDNVKVPQGHLLTGAGFEIEDGQYISLVVKSSKITNYFNQTTLGEGKTTSAPKSGQPRTNIDLADRERPPKKMNQTYEISKAGENYITLTLSKYSNDHKNRAVVPYFAMTAFDAKNSPTPLSGLGLAYMGWGDYTGFLVLKHLSPVYVHFVDPSTISAQQRSQG